MEGCEKGNKKTKDKERREWKEWRGEKKRNNRK